jgi:hypothetical protein
MTAPATNSTYPGTCSRHDTAKQWLQRRLRKLPYIQSTNDDGDGGLQLHGSTKRPRTAPSIGTVEAPSSVLAIPPIPVVIEHYTPDVPIRPPSRPRRPDSGITRDINAWLDTSITHSPPLMGGITYWRKATVANFKDTAGIQHATPIAHESESGRPSTSQSQQMKSFRRRAKKIQVQMPLLVRTKSVRNASRKQINRRSNSMPIFAIAYASTLQAAPLMPLPTSLLRVVPAKVPTIVYDGVQDDELLLEQPQLRHDTPASGRSSVAEGNTERRIGVVSGRSIRSADSAHPSTAAAHITREDSTGDFSDVPSYSSGLPPPSYHSRPASILTTSSFGCIDGMSPAQRQISQQRAATQRGVKGKLRRFAQNFST